MMTRPLCCIRQGRLGVVAIEMMPFTDRLGDGRAHHGAGMTFIVAAMRSAARGVHARVDTEVAIAFAASWKPLV